MLLDAFTLFRYAAIVLIFSRRRYAYRFSYADAYAATPFLASAVIDYFRYAALLIAAALFTLLRRCCYAPLTRLLLRFAAVEQPQLPAFAADSRFHDFQITP